MLRLSLVAASGGYSLAVLCGLLTEVVSLVAEQTQLSDFNFTFTFHFHALEKEMATHSSVLAWRIPGTGEPGGLPSMGCIGERNGSPLQCSCLENPMDR